MSMCYHAVHTMYCCLVADKDSLLLQCASHTCSALRYDHSAYLVQVVALVAGSVEMMPSQRSQHKPCTAASKDIMCDTSRTCITLAHVCRVLATHQAEECMRATQPQAAALFWHHGAAATGQSLCLLQAHLLVPAGEPNCSKPCANAADISCSPALGNLVALTESNEPIIGYMHCSSCACPHKLRPV